MNRRHVHLKFLKTSTVNRQPSSHEKLPKSRYEIYITKEIIQMFLLRTIYPDRKYWTGPWLSYFVWHQYCTRADEINYNIKKWSTESLTSWKLVVHWVALDSSFTVEHLFEFLKNSHFWCTYPMCKNCVWLQKITLGGRKVWWVYLTDIRDSI